MDQTDPPDGKPEDDQVLSKLIRAHANRYRASPALQSAVRAQLALADAARRGGARAPGLPPDWRRRASARARALLPALAAWRSAGAGFAAGILVSALVVLSGVLPGEQNRLEQELVAGHVRALMQAHLTDVASTDQHTVKPWFQGKLDYAPPVRDLASDGFPLVGGRLDYMAGRSVAALVYQRRGHLINVFVWPTERAGTLQQAQLQGYNLLQWRHAGMQYWAVSDLNPGELQNLAIALRQ